MNAELKAAIDRISFASEVLAYCLDWSERDGLASLTGHEVRAHLEAWRQARADLDAITGAQAGRDAFG